MTIRHAVALGLALALLGLGPVAPGRAETWVRGALLSVDGDFVGPTAPNASSHSYDESNEVGASEASWALVSPSGEGPLADSAGEALHGVVRARAYTTHSGPGVYQGGTSTDAGFSDHLTFSAPGLAGQPGTVTFAMHVEGALSSASSQPAPALIGTSDAVATFRAESSLDSQDAELSGYSSSEEGFSEYVDDDATITIDFLFGEPVSVFFELELESSMWVDSSPSDPFIWAATGIADFQNTATWAGILDLRDGAGDPVEEFEVTSESGASYRNAMGAPEPGGALLLAAGCAALLAARRRS